MDYARIYREFIADRKAMPKPQGYTERHHIVPRSLGGGNEAANLIDLTAQDHIFAHVLLAKIYGGVMWAPVIAIFGQAARHRTPTRRELRLHALARQNSRKAMKGEGNPFFGKRHTAETLASISDRAIYTFKSNGAEVTGTRREIAEQTGLNEKNISAIVTGRSKNVWGWYSPIHNPDGLTRLGLCRSQSKKISVFHHDGRQWSGSLEEFFETFGTRFCLSRGRRSCQGWYTKAADAATHEQLKTQRALHASSQRGCIKGERNPMHGSDRRKDMTVCLRHSSGEIFEGSLKALADSHMWSASQYKNFKDVLRGKRIVGGCQVKSFKGWRLAA